MLLSNLLHICFHSRLYLYVVLLVLIHKFTILTSNGQKKYFREFTKHNFFAELSFRKLRKVQFLCEFNLANSTHIAYPYLAG